MGHAERAHALLSASGAHRWLVCTPSAKLEEDFPDTTSEAAREGTLAHELAELKARHYFYTPDFGKKKYTTRANKLKKEDLWKDEMERYTDEYLDYLKVTALNLNTAPYVAIEQKLDLGNWIPEGFGTADCVMVYGNIVHPGDRGQNIVYNYKAKPGTEESILAKISDICISMKAEDYLQLPDIIYHQVPVTLDPKAEKAYKELERKMVLALPEDEEEISVTSAAALSNKLLQLSNGAIYDENHEVHEVHGCKIEAFLELIESLQGKSVLVFYNFQHDRIRILKALEKLKLRVRELHTTEDENAWNRHEVDVLLTHPASSAYGLNLQQGGNHVIWFGLTWNYELYTQANKRLHRQGQEEKVIIHHLVSSGTRDEDVMLALEKKDDVQNWVMESLKARIRKIRLEV